MEKLKYFNYFFNLVIALSLVFVGYVIVDANSVNEVFLGKTHYVAIWLFFLACSFVVKEFLDYWFVSRSQINFFKVILEFIGVVFFAYILTGVL